MKKPLLPELGGEKSDEEGAAAAAPDDESVASSSTSEPSESATLVEVTVEDPESSSGKEKPAKKERKRAEAIGFTPEGLSEVVKRREAVARDAVWPVDKADSREGEVSVASVFHSGRGNPKKSFLANPKFVCVTLFLSTIATILLDWNLLARTSPKVDLSDQWTWYGIMGFGLQGTGIAMVLISEGMRRRKDSYTDQVLNFRKLGAGLMLLTPVALAIVASIHCDSHHGEAFAQCLLPKFLSGS